MALTVTPVYGSSAALTITLASLASDVNLAAGRAATAIANTTDLAVDSVVGGKVTTGTSPTAAKQIQIWLFGSYDGTSYAGGATGTDANLTPQGSATSLFAFLLSIPTTATSNQTYTWGPFSVAQGFGGTMPKNWGIFVVHNTGVALNATAGNHEVKYTPVKYISQ